MELRNIVRKTEEIQKDLPKQIMGEYVFQLFFLNDEEGQRVQVVEAKEIDSEELTQHLNQGKSIFITSKHTQERNKKAGLETDYAESWYFAHI
jgi:hypothetical protein